MKSSARYRHFAETFFIAFSGLVVAFGLAWLVLAKLNFSYGVWHDYGGIGEAIDKYGPQNRYKQGFHLTSRDQRIELFHQINRAINNGGEGLRQITYKLPDSKPQSLLREPEVVHLQDVANLVDVGRNFGLVVLFIWLMAWLYFYWIKKPPPSLALQFLSIAAIIFVVGLIVLIIGPVEVFYQLHIWAFPDGHEWFFYYQDSLMSTMMHAPALFGFIAVEWLLLALMFFIAIQACVKFFFTKVLLKSSE